MNSLPFAVVPVVIGPLQVLIAILPAILLSLAGLIAALLKPRAMWAGVRLLWRQKVVVAAIAGVVAGAVLMVRSFASSGGPRSGQVAGADWPMFRGDPGRRGNGGGGEPPADGGLVWSYAADVKTFFASPAVVGNRVYVSSADKGPLRDRGAVYCLDADGGGLVWKAAPSGYVATFSSPVVAGRFLVCGEGLHYTLNARVFCMDVLRQKVLWTYATHGHVESTPCIDKGRAYVGAGDDGYYCFRLQPDAKGRAVVLWHVPHERCPDADTSPAVHDGRVVVGCGMDGNAICCLDADTGAELCALPPRIRSSARPPWSAGGSWWAWATGTSSSRPRRSNENNSTNSASRARALPRSPPPRRPSARPAKSGASTRRRAGCNGSSLPVTWSSGRWPPAKTGSSSPPAMATSTPSPPPEKSWAVGTPTPRSSPRQH